MLNRKWAEGKVGEIATHYFEEGGPGGWTAASGLHTALLRVIEQYWPEENAGGVLDGLMRRPDVSVSADEAIRFAETELHMDERDDTNPNKQGMEKGDEVQKRR